MNKLILIPFNLPWEWSTDYTNQTAFELSKKHKVICYMWGNYLTIKEYILQKRYPRLLKRYSDNIYIFTPILFIPFRRFKKTIEWNLKINHAILDLFIFYITKKYRITQKILWVFDPKNEPLTKNFDKTWKLLYDCVDYYIGSGKGPEDSLTVRLEKKLAKKANYVFANSTVLKKHLQNLCRTVHMVPQGFRLTNFENFRASKKIPVIKKHGRPLVGYIGGISKRLDFPLLNRLINNNPGWDFAICGPVLEPHKFKDSQMKLFNQIKNSKNVYCSNIPKEILPGVINQFDIGIIPYDRNDNFNKYCYPMKIFELFYLGKPVISNEIMELHRFPDFIKIVRGVKAWEKAISQLLKKPRSKTLIRSQKKLAVENSWQNKISTILKIAEI